jgi:hypothetical protein
MKKKIAFIFCLFSICLSAQNWCAEGATWHYTADYETPAVGYAKIEYTGDTIINSQVCNKLTKTYFGYNFISNQFVSYPLGMEYTYEQNHIVYMFNDSNWDTLYNFNSSIGDSWKMAKTPINGTCNANGRITVTDTGTVIINGFNLRYRAVDYNYDIPVLGIQIVHDTIIEKIGNKQRYMLPFDYCNLMIDGNEGGPFRCYQDNNFASYHPYFPNACNFTVNITEQTELNTISIFPNPVSSTINIHFSKNEELKKLKIYDLLGNCIITSALIKSLENIDVSYLPNGIYFMNIAVGNSQKTFKIIKN